MTREPAPERLVNDGRIRFGMFDGPVREPNLLQAHAPLGFRLPRALQALRLKEWQAIQLGNGRFFVLVALFNAKTMALAQVKVFDRQTGQKTLFERKLPPWSFDVAQGLCGTSTIWEARGTRLSFDNRFDQGTLELSVDLPAGRNSPRMQGRVVIDVAAAESVVVSLPFDDNRGMYSHKGCFPCSGTLQVGDDSIEFGDAGGFCLLDDHKGYYPYIMKWDWVTGARVEGQRLAFNLTRNDNTQPQRWNENALFIDGRIHHLPPVTFARNGEGAGEHWLVKDEQGRVDLRFDVVLDGRVTVNALIAESRYRGPFGDFSGTLKPEGGPEVTLDGAFGMGEQFYLRT